MTKILNGCGLGVKLGLKYLENGKNYLFSEDFSLFWDSLCTATARHGVTRKRSTERLKHT